ncbi:MAG TPA: hypothetical protein VKX39_17235 [Bryobacteraceae bacterium]|nr:hypothetical protein [Bryobacteraceae bacterium]
MLARILGLRKAAMIYPIRPVPRCAVLADGFRSLGPVRVFPSGWNEEAAKFDPQAIAAPLPRLETLAGAVTLTHAVIVFRRQWEPRLDAAQRDRLWRAFRVPVFEQIIAEDCTLLAAECEAHDGLHIESAKFAAGDHEIDRSACACGKTTPRLTGREAIRRAAAYAR